MEITISEQSLEQLDEYRTIPVAYRVDDRLRVEAVNNGLGGILLVKERVPEPYDMNLEEGREEEMARWAKRWDTALWGVLSAFDGETRVGGAIIAYNTDDAYGMEGRKDIAALLDLRVHPDYRRKGIGKQLFQAALAWAHTRGSRIFKVETRNTNVSLCRLCAGQGCQLGFINRFADPAQPEEAQLIWYLYIG